MLPAERNALHSTGPYATTRVRVACTTRPRNVHVGLELPLFFLGEDMGKEMAAGWGDLLSAVLVGAVWGCTNPFLRRGSATNENVQAETTADITEGNSIIQSLLRFKRVGVWLPYLLNQSGSILYYKLLATSDLSLSVPVCNALALVFSSATSFLLGEQVDRPITAILGSLLVTLGVAICMASNENVWSEHVTSDGGDEL